MQEVFFFIIFPAFVQRFRKLSISMVVTNLVLPFYRFFLNCSSVPMIDRVTRSHPINRGILELQNKPLNNITYFITYENNQIHLRIPNFYPAAGWL